MANIKLKRYNGTSWDTINPETTWNQIQSKPSTFTPTSHTHTLSQITDAGTVAAIDLNSSTTQFLRGDGSFATPDIDGGNAQTLDNLDSTAFLRSNANDDFSGTLNYTPDTGTILSVDGQAILQRMTANGAITIGHDDAIILAGGDTSGVLNSNINNATETVFVGAEGGFVAYAFPSNNTAWSNRKEMNWNGTNLTLLGNNVLTTADEGSGNGLDADTLDGSHASAFYLASNPNGYTSNTGDITQVIAGTGLSGGGTSGAVTINADLSEFTDMTADIDGLVDEIILLDNGAERRKAIAEFKLSQFNNDAGWTSNSGDITAVTAGSGLSGGGTSGGVTLSHADTSSQASVNNSGRTYIQDITLDTYGHITGITSATETVTNTNTTYSAGTGLALSGTTFNLDFSELQDITLAVTDASEMILQVGSTEGRKALGEIDISVFNNDSGFTSNSGDITNVSTGSGLTGGGSSGSVTVSHADTSSQASVNNSGRTYIQDITLDGFGHITGITSATETVVNTDTVYTHPTHPGDDISIDTGALTGATVISDLDFNVTSDTLGHITDANATVSTRNLTASDIGAAASNHSHSDLVSVSGDTMTGDLVMEHDGTGTVSSHGIVFTSQFNNGDVVRELNTNSSGELVFNGTVAELTDTTYTLGSFGVTASATELNYTDGVTSNIQTQLNGKASSSHSHSQYLETAGDTMTGDLTLDHDGTGTSASSHGIRFTARAVNTDFTKELLMNDSGNLEFNGTELSFTDTDTVTQIRRDNTGTYRTGNINLVGGSNVTITETASGVFSFAAAGGGATYSSETLYIKRIWSATQTSDEYTLRYNAGTGNGTAVSTSSTYTSISLGYTPASTDKFMVEFSNNTSNSVEKGICFVGHGTFSSTQGLSVLSYDGYHAVDSGQLKIAKYFCQWNISSSSMRFRYGSKLVY